MRKLLLGAVFLAAPAYARDGASRPTEPVLVIETSEQPDAYVPVGPTSWPLSMTRRVFRGAQIGVAADKLEEDHRAAVTLTVPF